MPDEYTRGNGVLERSQGLRARLERGPGMKWKLRISRDEYADSPEDWPWAVDGYQPVAPKGMGRDTHPEYTDDVTHFATYALAVQFANLVLRLLRTVARASDVVHPFFNLAGPLVDELKLKANDARVDSTAIRR